MKALVTGSNGFIGSAFHAAFVERGYDVTAIDIKEGNDALDFFRWNREEFQIAVHAAAFVGGRMGIENHKLRMATNAALDSWFFRWLDRSGTQRAVTFSSSAAYPIDLQGPMSRHRLVESDIDLDNPRNGDAIYGECKLFLERLVRESRASGKNVLCLRPFSITGPTQTIDYPFPSFIERALRRDEEFVIWGDGEARRDWLFLDDLIAGTLAMIDQDAWVTTNVGNGVAVSFNKLADAICRAVGYSPRIKHLLDKPVGVHYRVCDPAYFNSFYTPRISLEQGIEMALGKVAA